jgi:hypothetical protein
MEKPANSTKFFLLSKNKNKGSREAAVTDILPEDYFWRLA